MFLIFFFKLVFSFWQIARLQEFFNLHIVEDYYILWRSCWPSFVQMCRCAALWDQLPYTGRMGGCNSKRMGSHRIPNTSQHKSLNMVPYPKIVGPNLYNLYWYTKKRSRISYPIATTPAASPISALASRHSFATPPQRGNRRQLATSIHCGWRDGRKGWRDGKSFISPRPRRPLHNVYNEHVHYMVGG